MFMESRNKRLKGTLDQKSEVATKQLHRLREENTELIAEISDLRRENDRLKGNVTSLKADVLRVQQGLDPNLRQPHFDTSDQYTNPNPLPSERAASDPRFRKDGASSMDRGAARTAKDRPGSRLNEGKDLGKDWRSTRLPVSRTEWPKPVPHSQKMKGETQLCKLRAS